jgi:hypothetical protein
MTEEQIERAVEADFNRLDRGLMAGRMTQDEYDHEAKVITDWADREYLTVRRK